MVAATLALLHLLNLAGAAYAQYADRTVDRPDDERTLAAADRAATLNPWSSRHLALQGWILAERGSDGPAEAAYRRALALAPADPMLWSEYALFLGRARHFELLETAVRRANDLAPASPAVQATLAAIAVSYWDAESAQFRERSLTSVHYELNHDREPFLDGVFARGRALVFCRDIAPAVNEVAWCAQLRGLTANCHREAAESLCWATP